MGRPGTLQSLRSQRVRHDLVTAAEHEATRSLRERMYFVEMVTVRALEVKFTFSTLALVSVLTTQLSELSSETK